MSSFGAIGEGAVSEDTSATSTVINVGVVAVAVATNLPGIRGGAKVASVLGGGAVATRRFIGSMLALNVFELISETFESDAMRGLWAYWSSMVGPADSVGSGAYFLGFAGVHRHLGVQRPRGGMTNLVEAFKGKLEMDANGYLIASNAADKLVLLHPDGSLAGSYSGARPLAVTDNMNFGNPQRPEIMGQFAGCIEGIRKALDRQKALLLVGEMGTGKTLMSLAAIHAHTAGLPYR